MVRYPCSKPRGASHCTNDYIWRPNNVFAPFSLLPFPTIFLLGLAEPGKYLLLFRLHNAPTWCHLFMCDPYLLHKHRRMRAVEFWSWFMVAISWATDWMVVWLLGRFTSQCHGRFNVKQIYAAKSVWTISHFVRQPANRPPIKKKDTAIIVCARGTHFRNVSCSWDGKKLVSKSFNVRS